MNSINTCQNLLLTWMCLKDYVNYDTIKRYCQYLNVQYSLNIENHPAWKIFLPLFLNGNVDFCGDNKFKVTEPILVCGKDRYVYSNIFERLPNSEEVFPLIFRTRIRPNLDCKKYDFNITSILSSYPSIDKIVERFEASAINDFQTLSFDNYRLSYGIASNKENETMHYLVYPNRRVTIIPAWSISPDAICVAYCYGRFLSGEPNGIYNKEKQILLYKSFRIPVMLYRVLMLESLLKGFVPYKEKDMYVFEGIGQRAAKEVNRIMLNTIQYE